MLAFALFAPTRDARAEQTPSATMTCERIAQPGRVRCDVEARASAGASIRWGDVQVVAVPSFAAALRGRMSPREASAHEDGAWAWPFALVARERGAGDVRVRVRLLECRGATCVAREIESVAPVKVGD
jgi:hypothetical protein